MWRDLMTGKEFNTELMLEFYEHMALDIRREKERIGGDFAVATFVPKKKARDLLRKILGSDLIIVILSMSREERRERVLIRHPGDQATADRMDVSLQLNIYNVVFIKIISQPDGRTGGVRAKHCPGQH